MNCIASIATVATGPCARRLATMPAAMSIWLSTQPPKIWPLALMSPGRGTTRRVGSRSSAMPIIPTAGILVVGLVVALAMRWPATLPALAAGPTHGRWWILALAGIAVAAHAGRDPGRR